MSASRFGSPEAVVLLALESAKHPLHIASLQTFTPPANAGLGFGRQIYEAMRARIEVAPIFRRHPAPTRRATSGLRWREDAGIGIEYHLRYVALPTPGSNREFFDAISRIHSRHLDRRKPLWEAHVIDGLDDGRFAVYIKTHHALFDGITGIKLLRKSLSTDPNDHDVEVVWSPETNADEAREVVGQEKVAEAKESAHHFRESVSLIRAALRERDPGPLPARSAHHIERRKRRSPVQRRRLLVAGANDTGGSRGGRLCQRRELGDDCRRVAQLPRRAQ